MSDKRNIVSIKSIEFEFDGVGVRPTVYFEVPQPNGGPVILSESVRLEKAVFESYDEIVRLARMQLRERLQEMVLSVDAQLLKGN